jgi:flagellar biogenesis protein FliO
VKLHRLSTLLTAILYFQSGLSGQDTLSAVGSPSITENKSVSETGGAKKVYTPRSNPPRTFKDPPLFDATQWIGPVVVLLLLVGTMFFLTKKGYFGVNRHATEGKLRIKDQIMLGNRQFLVVVEYGKKEILVGIGPGFIRHVCDMSEVQISKETQGKFDDLLDDKIESENSEN